MGNFSSSDTKENTQNTVPLGVIPKKRHRSESDDYEQNYSDGDFLDTPRK
jgi:hypothetical protein